MVLGLGRGRRVRSGTLGAKGRKPLVNRVFLVSEAVERIILVILGSLKTRMNCFNILQ